MPELILIGSVALDSVRTPYGQREEIVGGSATFASTAAGLFTSTGIVAVVGEDFPLEHVQAMKDRGVDTGGLTIVEGRTFRWSGVYEDDMAQAHTLNTELGVFEDFEPVVPAAWRGTPFVFLANIHPALQLDVLDQLDAPKLVACDTMNFWIDSQPDLVRRVVERVDLMYLNDAEIRSLTGQASLHRAAHAVIEMGPEIVVVKKGEHGAMIYTQHDVVIVPAVPLKTVKDPTGAGDTFAGGMLGYLTAHGSLDAEWLANAALVGSVLASFTVEDFSLDRLSQVTREDIERRYNTVRKMISFGPLC